MRAWTGIVAAFVLGFGAGPVPASAGQLELDRVLSEVNSRIITRSDVSQARELALVDDVSSDEAVQRALETRVLILGEVARGPVLPVSDADVAARRQAWEARVGGPDRARALLASAGMSDAALTAWMRDDVRIQEYLARQFGAMPDAERPKATADWMSRLRLRAGLK